MAEGRQHDREPRGVTLRGHHLTVVDDKPTFWAKAEAGTWEPETLAALERMARPGVVVLDIGAWIGPTALFAAALGADVLAVEADPAAFSLLSANVAANPQFGEQISLLHAAAGPRPGTMHLGAPRKLGDSMSSVLMAGHAAAGFETDAITPDALAARVPEGRRLLVKIDIEGGEYDLAPALAPLSDRCTEGLLVAFHPRILARAGRSPEAIRALTEPCFAALSRFEASVLEPQHAAANPIEVAMQDNVTVLFRLS
jgi:FkbM family methyltransferase